ncbi:chromosome segregation protein SMC [Jatrophihabitans telluris]|uniref:Chromosome partition protein Smc n=2 Tax=Jatrophihabitans TaxID=1434010 RepID=A0ABY4R2C6_9ACTN|nr:chromosome segregation protein SMC [Jatrophihabitans telluris]UQX89975.1 chromosome segregation protein SMC [Jatrophihabitans telluris]
MHLKSLTLKGFKSFASATTLRFEPGITAVVGPNGSGKSNVVDAIAWVLGEQGAKALRGGKMEDVIFAGTAGRPPLGRAEVTLTIDNADNALPIEYTEVSITRRMFRDGASEYEINGEGARLLDIQELLSDSGIGREMHVIVGQGQLDSVLQARPEDRRGFIEEAAGVLKHRKRKEKALRKLDAMQANLTRLTDLTGELRRQLKPLGKQAEVARRAAGVQAELRDSRLRLLADDLVSFGAALAAEVADETAVRSRRAEVEQALTVATERETELEQALAADAPALATAQEVYFTLSALAERFRGTQTLAAERARHLSESPEQERRGRDPEEMLAEARQIRQTEQALTEELEVGRETLQNAVALRQEAERELADAERAIVAAARAVADRREGLAKLAGQVNALRTRASAGGDEIARIAAGATQARERASGAGAELSAAQSEVGALDEGELDLDSRHEQAVERYDEVAKRLATAREAERSMERDVSTWTARRDALALGLTRKDGAGALLAAGSELPGMLGSVAALLSVEAGYEAALTAALGAIADAVAVTSAGSAAAALELLREQDGGRAGLLIGESVPAPGAQASEAPSDAPSEAPSEESRRRGWPTLPATARWALDVVTAPHQLRPALDEALQLMAVVADLTAASELVAAHPDVRAVTAAGDVLGRNWAFGGSASSPSALEIQAAVDEAEQRATAALAEHGRLQQEVSALTDAAGVAKAEVERTLEALNESDARLNAVAERLAQLAQTERSALAEAQRLDLARTAAEQARDADLAGLVELEERLRLAESEPTEAEPSAEERDARAEFVHQARQAEMDARLSVRTQEERVRALAGRAEQLQRAADNERQARQRQEAARVRRAHGAKVAAAVEQAAGAAAALLIEAVARAAAEREQVQQSRHEREAMLSTARHSVRELGAELTRLTDAVHKDEVARAEQRLRIEQLQARAVEEFGVAVDALIADYGPDQPVPPSAQESAEYLQARERGEDVVAPQPGPFDRPSQEKRAARAERDLALLGKVNPLALEEFAALEERHQFLATQLEDLKNTRRDLMTVVKEVDDRILEVFTAAYHDVEREFEIVFKTLFPGGEGRLVLTDPDDMLLTGIDVEARPPGKKVKRLSLLSGGERSLTAVALLVAIFRARPSPFYVMDEVEAALDDVNLTRLVGLIAELKASSQLIIITHQKRTMEVADALYGVTMRGDGITQVISQRLRDDTSESIPD